MPGFYYYLPGVMKEQLTQGELLNRDLLRERGLDEVLADVTHTPKHASLCNISRDSGPDKKSGVLLAIAGKYAGAPDVVTYRPDLHPWHWKAVGESDKLWIGVLTSGLPMPSDLERLEQIGGAELLDGHGRVWRLPIAREPNQHYGALPQSFTFDAAGEPLPVVLPRWSWLWELSGEIRDAYMGLIDRDLRWMVKAAVRILAVNYRIGPQELSLLHDLGKGVLTQQIAYSIGRAAFGFEVLEEAKKNSTEPTSDPPAGSLSSSTPGGETPSDSPTTDRAGAA